jgi:nicotinamidase-related amidase
VHVTSVVDAEPYPWPYDGPIDWRRLALVVAGDQRAWADRSVRVAEVTTTIDCTARALRAAGAAVVHVRHAVPVARPSGLPPARDDEGWGVITSLGAGDLVVDAGGVNGFFAGPLDAMLRSRGVDHLVFAGFGAEAAVDSTLRAANDRGYECLTLVDGTAPFDESTGRHALSSITMSGGIFGAIATSAALLAALPVLEVSR